MKKEGSLSAERRRKTILSIVLTVICIIWVLPVLAVVINSFKVNTFVKTATFSLPLGEMWAGFTNFVTGITLGNYNFWQAAFLSLFITFRESAQSPPKQLLLPIKPIYTPRFYPIFQTPGHFRTARLGIYIPLQRSMKCNV